MSLLVFSSISWLLSDLPFGADRLPHIPIAGFRWRSSGPLPRSSSSLRIRNALFVLISTGRPFDLSCDCTEIPLTLSTLNIIPKMISPMFQTTPSPDIWGLGTFVDNSKPNVPRDARRVFELLAKSTPGFAQDEGLWTSINFDGSAEPITPGPLKAAVIAAALHAMAGVVAKELLELRHGGPADHRVNINTDHAALWLGTVGLTKRNGVSVPQLSKSGKLGEIFPVDLEKDTFKSSIRLRTTAVYPTKAEGVWYQLHGSLGADPVLESIGLDASIQCKDHADAYRIIGEEVRKFGPEELEMRHIQNGLCGSICYTPAQWRGTRMHKELAKHPLLNYTHASYMPPTPAVPLPAPKVDERPLAGIKVVELVRIIAGPVIGNTLASLGADVIRVGSSRLPDFNVSRMRSANAASSTPFHCP